MWRCSDYLARGFVFLFLTFGLAACGIGMDDGESDVTMMDTPPTPPNCPDSMELDNITLPSGEIAEVRVIRDRKLTLYVPTNWFEGRFIEAPADRESRPSRINRITPVISRNECPAVIHLNDGADESVFIFTLPRTVEPITAMPSNLPYNGPMIRTAIARVSDIKLSHRPNEQFADRIISWPTRENPSAYIAMRDGKYLIRYAWPVDEPMGSKRWNSYREAAIEMFDWLTTPPRDRNNEITLLNPEVWNGPYD